ncbi:MAG: hypothetical protein HYV45_02810 [Candidatus Moranbacteria bacterium]|nr:hypothetical protein [Candidatus Moranbacteria bacterium]
MARSTNHTKKQVSRNKKKVQLPKKFLERADDFLLSDTLSATATKFFLVLLTLGGVAFLGATVPGLIKAADIFRHRRGSRRKTDNDFSKRSITNSIAYMKKHKLVKILKDAHGKTTIVLTNKGRRRVAEYSLEMVEIKKPTRWDGKWRVLIFDIPSNSKVNTYARDALRNKIKELGFCQIQKSVWAHPYDCENEILFIAEMFGIQKYIEILTVERMLHEKLVRERFPKL